MTQLPQGFGFDLADAFPGYPEFPPHLLQGAAAAVLQPESQLQDSSFPGVEGREHVIDLFLEELV